MGLASHGASAGNQAPEVGKSFGPAECPPGERGGDTFECVTVVTTTEQWSPRVSEGAGGSSFRVQKAPQA